MPTTLIETYEQRSETGAVVDPGHNTERNLVGERS